MIKRKQASFRYHASAAIESIRDDCRRNQQPDIYQTSYKPLLLQTSQNFRRKKMQTQSLQNQQKAKSSMNNFNMSTYTDFSYQSAFTPKPKSSKSFRYAFNINDRARKASRATHIPYDSTRGISSSISEINPDQITTFLMRLYLAKTKDLQIIPNHKQEKIFINRLRQTIKDKQFVAPECDFGYISTQVIAKYLQKHQVQKIILDKNPLGDESCKKLAEIIPRMKIKELSLVSINITSKSGSILLKSIVGAQFLQTLNLSSPEGLNRNRINPEGFSEIARVFSHPLCRLHSVNLANTGMGQSGFISFLMGFQQKSHLKFKLLNLSYNQISISQTQQSFVTNCIGNISVERLQLQGNNISDLGGKILAYIIGGKYGRSVISLNLNYLDVSDNKIKSYGFQSLCNLLPTNKKLSQFYADKNDLAERDAFYSVRNLLMNTWSTKILSLRHTLPAAPESIAHHIKSLSEGLFANKSLKQLDISYTNLEQNGFFNIFQSLQTNKTLKILKLEGCGVSDSFLIKAEHLIKNCKSLNSLNLCNNFITDKGAKVLLKILAEAHDLMQMNLKKNCISLHLLSDIQYQIKQNKNMSRPQDPQFVYIHHVSSLQEEQRKNIQAAISQLSSKKNYLSARDLAIDIVKDQQEIMKRQQQIKAEKLRINKIQSQIHSESLEKLKKRKKFVNNEESNSFSIDNTSFLVTN